MSWPVRFFLFFGIWLVPYLSPGFQASDFYFAYMRASTLVAIMLVMVAVACVPWALVAKVAGSSSLSFALRTLRWAITGIVICVTIQAVVKFVPKPLPRGAGAAEFDSARWKASGSAERGEHKTSIRESMVEDVVENVLPGRTKPEIEALLGQSEPPIMEGGLNDVHLPNSGDLNYHLSFRVRDVGNDDRWLFIWLGGDGRFERHRIPSFRGVADEEMSGQAASGIVGSALALLALFAPDLIALVRSRVAQ